MTIILLVPCPVGSDAGQATSAWAASFGIFAQCPGPSNRSGSDGEVQAEPFDFRWLRATVNNSPSGLTLKVWARTGRLSVSIKSGLTLVVSIAWVPARLTDAGLYSRPTLIASVPIVPVW